MQPEWTRSQVWSDDDARHRRYPVLLALVACATVAALWIANYSWVELLFLDDASVTAQLLR